jgi:uncharacterized RDD family membrane protein YckC
MNQESTQQFALAGTGKRILAFLIDHFALTGLIVITAFLLVGNKFSQDTPPNELFTSMLLVLIPGFLIYFSKDSFGGMSLGKRIAGIMIRSEKDRNEIPSFGRLFLRNLPIMLWPVEFLVLCADSKEQRLGDKLAATVVVQNPNRLPRRTRAIILVAVAIVFFTSFTFCAGYLIKQTDAYKLAIKEIAADKDIIAETGGVRGYGMIPGGSASTTNDAGEAQLQIKVIGNNKDIVVHAYLKKEKGSDWQLIELHREE